MKTLSFYLILFLMALNLTAQNTAAHQHQAPPVTSSPFIRGITVDCTNDIITDIYHGNTLGLFAELKQYIRDNYITYLALYGLDHSAVIGNSQLEPSLRYFISDLRQNFPDIKIAAVWSTDGFFSASRYLRVNDYFHRSCFPGTFELSMPRIDSLVNTVSKPENLKRSELCKFFLRAAALNKSENDRVSNRCRAAFDVLYLDYPYWENAGTSSLSDIQAEFETYKSILKVMQMLKCNFTCINSVESTFLPTDLYRLQGWTATDQITEADPLIDRMMIPAYSSDPSDAFDIGCRTFHLLSDRFTKYGTNFYVGLSAESNLYRYCNSMNTPQNHLGDYLDGSASNSGNMYSVEKSFTDKLNNPTYFCAGCSCYSFNDNQYSTNNAAANRCVGSLWSSYTMMKDHGITRHVSQELTQPICADKKGVIEVRLPEDEQMSDILLTDVDGKIIRRLENIYNTSADITTEGLREGIYFLQVISTKKRKFNRYLPVLYR